MRGRRTRDGHTTDGQVAGKAAAPAPGKTNLAGQRYGAVTGDAETGNEEGVSVKYLTTEKDFLSRSVRVATFGEADGAEDIPGMVAAIIAKAGGKKISRLSIVGHGSEGSQCIAENAAINIDAVGELAPLRAHFTSGAVVHFSGCNVGGGPLGHELLTALARTWGVEVSASTAFERPFMPGIEGHNAIAASDGSMRYDESWIAGMGRTAGSSDDNDARDLLAWFSQQTRGLSGMTMETRYSTLSKLLGGYTGDDDAAWIMKLFETTPATERRTLYKYVEGHDWSGDFKQGWFTNDDALWNGLDGDQADQLKELLNEGFTAGSKP